MDGQRQFKQVCIAALMLLAMTGFVRADTIIITPKAATSTTQYATSASIWQAIDGSGLSSWGKMGDILTNSHAAFPGGAPYNAWLSASTAINDPVNFKSTTEVLTFQLRQASTVDRIHLWQFYYGAPQVGRELKSFDLRFSTDGGATYGTVIDAATLGNFAQPGSAPTFSQTKTFTSQAGVTHIMISNITVFSSTSYIGLDEIRFGGPGDLNQARSVDMLNPSFEFHNGGTLPIYGWAAVGSVVPWASASDGTYSADCYGGNVSQTFTEPIMEGTYTLTVDATARATGGSVVYVRLYAQTLGSTVASNENYSLPTVAPSWTPITVTYTVTAGDANIGKQLGIDLKRTSGTAQAFFDNVRLTYTPPPKRGTLVYVK